MNTVKHAHAAAAHVFKVYRVAQFSKVELFAVSTAEQSAEMLSELQDAVRLSQNLSLLYCTGGNCCA